MLQLTQKQISQISQKLEQGFIEKIKAYYKQQLTTQQLTVNDQELTEEISTLVNQAKRYGYKSQKEIFLYIEIIMLTGGEQSQHDNYQWVYDNLKQNSKTSSVDIQKIYDAIVNQKANER